jgi:hypothetical protein
VAFGENAGAALGYAAGGQPIVLVTVPTGIVVAGAAIDIGAGSNWPRRGIRHQLCRLMGVPDDPPEDPPDNPSDNPP